MRHRIAPRRGLTILEVMISIGIASVGLLGALALLPLASTLAQIGLNEDAKSAVGRAAVSEFKVARGARPDMWVNPDASAAYSAASLQAFCIDPRYITENSLTGPGPFYFPAVAHAHPMQRITLRRQPGGAVMPLHFAREIFQSGEDLEFYPDEDKTLPPVQKYFEDAAMNPIKRQSFGKISWMAIVTPVAGSDSDLYNLAIVVFNSRDLDQAATPAVERVSSVSQFYGAGVTGGDLELTGTTNDDVDVRRDDWVMLSQDIDPGNDPGGEIYRWYRVIESDVDDAATPLTRDVTLMGPDWDADPAIPTQATFLPGVVAVYERTIRLETTSLWTD